jgi:hypothetical protein
VRVRIGRVGRDCLLVPGLRAGLVAALGVDEAERRHRLDEVGRERERLEVAPLGLVDPPALQRQRGEGGVHAVLPGLLRERGLVLALRLVELPLPDGGQRQDVARGDVAGRDGDELVEQRRRAGPVLELRAVAGVLQLRVERHAVLRVHARHLGALLGRGQVPEGAEHLLGLAVDLARGGDELPSIGVREDAVQLGAEAAVGGVRFSQVPLLARVGAQVVQLGRGARIHLKPPRRTPKSGAMPKPSSASSASTY